MSISNPETNTTQRVITLSRGESAEGENNIHSLFHYTDVTSEECQDKCGMYNVHKWNVIYDGKFQKQILKFSFFHM